MLLSPFSPIPGRNAEIRSCLTDFASVKGIDITGCEERLMALDLTPDIVPDVPVERLCSVTGALEGQLRKFQNFCKEWNARLDEKCQQIAKRRQLLE